MHSAAWFLLGILLTIASGAVSISLVSTYGATELTWLQFLSMLVIYPAIVWVHRQSFQRLSVSQASGLALPGMASLLGLYLFLVSVKGIDLATSTGLFFSYPFVAVALAALFLRERVELLVWALTGLGFLGVLVLFNPQAAGVSLYSVVALGSGVAVAVKMMLTRGLGLGLPPLATAGGEASAAVLLLLPFISLAQAFSGALPGQMVLYLVLANASRILVVIALARAEVASLAPLGYSEIVLAAAIQWIAFGKAISAVEAVAFAVILAAGLGVVYFRRSSSPSAAKTCGQPGRLDPLAIAQGTPYRGGFLPARPANVACRVVPETTEMEMPKMKTKSAAKKRFSFTASGRAKAGVAGKRHGMIKRTTKFIRDASGTMLLSASDTKIVKKYMPYDR
jgi:large subunit ribosomal protein L35